MILYNVRSKEKKKDENKLLNRKFSVLDILNVLIGKFIPFCYLQNV